MSTLKEQFDRDGYLILENFFNPIQCSRICHEFEEIHHNFESLKEKHKDLHRLGLWSIKSPHLASEKIKAFTFSEENKKLCLELIGTEVDLFWAATACKPAGEGKAFPWHQDTGYDEEPKDYITIWSAFDVVDENNGGLWVIPDSHKDVVYPHEFRKLDDENYGGVFIQGDFKNLDKAIPVKLNPGDAVCMSSRLIHASFKNESGSQRRGMITAFIETFDYQTKEVRGIPEGVESFLRNGEVSL